jgi:hypothetical protein
MRALVLSSAIAAALCSGCFDDGWHEGDPVDRAVTAWQVIPSLDESRAAIALEPRKIHRDEQGVLTLGYQTTLVGPTIAVENGETVATFETGAMDVAVGTTRAWLFRSDITSWEHDFPAEGPPDAPIVRGTRIDRATFARSAPVTFAPPIEVPRMLGDALLDLPTMGRSDVVRDVQVRHRTDDGGATVLHSGRGFGVVTCTGTTGVAVVYAGDDGATHAVSVRSDGAGGWTVRDTTLSGVEFDPRFATCDADASHIALFVGTGMAVYAIDTGTEAYAAIGATPPARLSNDGAALTAVRDSDRSLVHATASGMRALGAISAESPESPARAGDLAMFELEAALVVVDLPTGTLGPRVLAIRTTMYPYEMKAVGDRFVVEISNCCETTWQDELTQLMVVDATTATPLPLPDARWSPDLVVPDDRTFYLKVYDSSEDTAVPWLASYDATTFSQQRVEELPLCDETLVLEERGCR